MAIQKGIVENVIDKYQIQVRIPVFDKAKGAALATKTEDLSTSIVCTIPGIDISYVEDDVVLVAFENDELGKPIILGLLYRESEDNSQSSISYIDKNLTDISSRLETLEGNTIYTHLKYSNDGGKTLSSRYYPYEMESGSLSDLTQSEIVSNMSRQMSWQDTDTNLTYIINFKDLYSATKADSNEPWIKIYLKGNTDETVDPKIISIIDTDSIHTFDVGNYTQYRIVINIKLEELQNYPITLISNDKVTSIGDYSGRWFGFNISTTPDISYNSNDYTWFSFFDIIEELTGEVEERVNVDEVLLWKGGALNGESYYPLRSYTSSDGLYDTTGLVDSLTESDATLTWPKININKTEFTSSGIDTAKVSTNLTSFKNTQTESVFVLKSTQNNFTLYKG